MLSFYFFKLLSFIFRVLEYSNTKYIELRNKNIYNLPNTVSLGKVSLVGKNISIGGNTYINSGLIQVGHNSRVVIGEWCAIGYNVSILAITHDNSISTGPENERPIIEKDIIIGNHVWIGSNVFIKEGIIIGDNSIIGANSVVTKNVNKNQIVGGIPAKHIKYKEI